MAWSDIDEKYCISFVFKGNFTVTLISPNGARVPRELDGNFHHLEAGISYQLEVEADPTLPISSKPAPLLSRREDLVDALKRNARHDDITAQLKSMTTEQLQERGEEYRQLIEARDLEDILHT